MDNNVAGSRTFAVENEKSTIQPLLIEAERQFRAMDFEGTFLTLENAVAQNPNSAEALLLRARFKKIIGMETEADRDQMMANRINPYAANLYGYNGKRGLLNLIALQPAEAVQGLSTYQKLKYYYQALDRKTNADEIGIDKFEQLEVVIMYIESDQLVQALNTIDQVLAEFPKSAIAYDLRGNILKKQGKSEAAIDAFLRAVKIDSEFAIAWYNLGVMEKDLENYQNAKTYLDRAIELQSDLTKAYFARAVLHKKMGDKESALNDYNRIIEMNGDSYMEAFLNRGLTKKMLGDYNGAFADLNQVIDEFPNNAELRKNRGNLHLLFGLNQKAIQDYSEAIRINGDYAEAYFNRGLAFFLIYDKVSGCADLDQSIKLGYEKAAEIKTYFCTN